MRRPRSVTGMTLVEVLAVLALMVIVTGLLSEIILGSLRIFEQTRTEDAMRSDSELVLGRMISQLREAMTVNAISAGMVDVHMPAENENGTNVVDYGGLQPGRRLKFYRGDGSGAIDASGRHLWEWSQLGNSSPTTTLASTGFSDCLFGALTVTGKTMGVRITLTYSSTVLGKRTVTASYSQEATFRNVP